MLSSSNRGEIAVLKVELEANNKGYFVSYPRNSHLPYDCIIDDGKKLSKVQVKFLNRKSGRNKDALELVLNSPTHKAKPYTKEIIDLLLIYIPIKDCILCVKPTQFHNKNTFWFNLVNPKSRTYYKNFIW